jgi:hypothetical protein
MFLEGRLMQLSSELMVTVSALRSSIAWIFIWIINEWIIADGMLVVFLTVGAIHMVVLASTIPMYYYGKRVRKWLYYEARLFEKAGLD